MAIHQKVNPARRVAGQQTTSTTTGMQNGERSMSINNVPRFQHVKVNGTQCGSPALRRRRFCYFHENYRLTQARLLADESNVRICNFPLLEDANSIQVAVMQVIHLLGSGKVDTKVAGLMLYALQTASANMKRVSFETENATD